MVLVRESPRAKLSPDKSTAQWPPKSPFQALLSSPSGRKKWQNRQSRADDERSLSPSPLRKPMRSSQALQELAGMADGEEDVEDEEEDEEVLRLRLQQIQAKLKLAKLKKKNQASAESGRNGESRRERATSPRKVAIQPSIRQPQLEVPVSPTRRERVPQEQLSPARRRLGLTAPVSAHEVSLKRARDGIQFKRSSSRQDTPREEQPRSKSFSQRLKDSREEEEQKQAKQDRLERMRSSGFSHTRTESTQSARTQQLTLSACTSRLAEADSKRPSAGHIEASSARKEDGVSRSASARIPREKEHTRPHAKDTFPDQADLGSGHAGVDSDSDSLDTEDANPDSGYDPFSKIHLKKRHISHSVVAREMEGKEVYTLPRLLKEVKSPHYEPPDCETDYIVFAVLASKSNPFDHAQTHRTAEHANDNTEAPRNKFMVLHLCDMKWEIDCFLFGTAFNQFWKLTPGTLLAIMNPAILPPKGNQHNGRFSLKLGSSEDAVMEIGVARDLGYCSAVKKDGQQCGDWVDRRKTEACEFHISLQIDKNRAQRMEVNTMFRNPEGNKDDRTKSRAARETRGKGGTTGGKYHREYGQLYSVPGGPMGKSAAGLLDAEDTDALHNMTQEEASRKRIANAQKERDLAKKLGEMGRGVGAEYMRAKHSHTTSTTTVSSTTSSGRGNDASTDARNALFSKPTAAKLGLLGKKASDAHLSPAKDRKRHFGLGALSMHSRGDKSSEPMGWGGAKKAGLIQPKESRLGSPERGQTKLPSDTQSRPNRVRPRSQDSSMRSNGSQSPAKKRARFDLEKGIRIPGRESLPGAAAAGAAVDDEDDDLDIV